MTTDSFCVRTKNIIKILAHVNEHARKEDQVLRFSLALIYRLNGIP